MKTKAKSGQRIQRHFDGSVEKWRDVVGYVGYYRISDRGRVKSVDRFVKTVKGCGRRFVKGNLKKLSSTNRHGHYTITLYKKGKIKGVSVHRLVLEAFVGPCPTGMECRHFPDRNPKNNRLENIRWDTPKNNQNDRFVHGTRLTGERNPNAAFSNNQIRKIRRMWSTGKYLKQELADMFHVSRYTIYRLLNGAIYREC